MPSGTAITTAPSVTRRDPSINGRMPSLGGSDMGYQCCPAKKSERPMLLNKNTPSFRRKMNMRATNTMEATHLANMRRSIRNYFSFFRCIIVRSFVKSSVAPQDDTFEKLSFSTVSFYRDEIQVLDYLLAFFRVDEIYKLFNDTLRPAICIKVKRPGYGVVTGPDVFENRLYICRGLSLGDRYDLLLRAYITHAIISDRVVVSRYLVRYRLGRRHEQGLRSEFLRSFIVASAQDMLLEEQMRARVDLAG